ncbi:LAMI_0A05336g1_1 [Lachancea mirantina]|uniref:LAMI_0A05336g1_1 n=1 Tax=Lachancea mirantina TaxID=1230905 RepID=A0A1G4IQ66_9SACH|nr:LAMI_0A05336g1_1 [Lachancea mirantina]
MPVASLVCESFEFLCDPVAVSLRPAVPVTALRKLKSGQVLLPLLDCQLLDPDFPIAASPRNFQVALQHHCLENEATSFLVASVNEIPVLKCNTTGGTRALELALHVAAQKTLESEIRRKNSDLRALSQKSTFSNGKKRRKTAATAASNPVRIQYRYRELECSQPTLTVTQDGHWRIDFSLSLVFMSNSVNHFAPETNHLLDTLFSRRDRHHFMQHHISHWYFQKQFVLQTTKYTRERLSSAALAQMAVTGLKVSLMPFQQRAVQWMHSKETAYPDYLDISSTDPAQSPALLYNVLNRHVSFGYEVMPLATGNFLWNKFTGFILSQADALQLCQKVFQDEVKAKGVLSEEMGLGKTLEVLALILLNKRRITGSRTFVSDGGKSILKTCTNLIVCPDTILKQWLDEIQNHVEEGSLTVFHYCGFQLVKDHFGTSDVGTIVEELSKFDIVITSYTAVSAEVHYAEFSSSSRMRRGPAPKYDYSSPLSLMQFFRIILDEVHMLRGESTNAARCTGLLHRVHTWGVSGTPIGTVTDFKTVLSYLQLHPFHEYPKIVDAVRKNIGRDAKNPSSDSTRLSGSVHGVHFDVNDLMDIFPRFDLCIRHSKKQVSDQIKIPPQNNYIVPIDFFPIEQDNYSNLMSSFLDASGFDRNGQGRTFLGAKELNYWLSMLRKTCCHALMPKSSSRQENEQDIGNLQTIDTILDSMKEEIMDKIDALHRENYTLKIQSAQAETEIEARPLRAIEILEDVQSRLLTDFKLKFGVENPYHSHSLEATQLSEERNKAKARFYMDLLHQCFFFIATAYYFLGSKKLEAVDDENEKLKLSGSNKKLVEYSDVFNSSELENIEKHQALEQQNYGVAEKLRRTILADRIAKVDGEIAEVSKFLTSKGSRDREHLKLIDFKVENFSANLTVESCFKQMNSIFKAIDTQASQFNEYADELKALSFKPLTKEYTEEDEDDKALEYETSINDQDRTFALLDCMGRILNNRDQAAESDEELKTSSEVFSNTETFSDDHVQLITNLKLIQGTTLKQVFTELKNVNIVKNFGNATAKKEDSFEAFLMTYESQISRIKRENKAKREVLKKFNEIYNAKTAYFSNLQRISDSLVSLIQLEPSAQAAILNTRNDSQFIKNTNKINNLRSRIKYLETLSVLKNDISHDQKFNCTICFSEIYMGTIIKCGHFFCRTCIHSWLRNKSACPLCKTEVHLSDMYTFKFQEYNEPEEVEDRPIKTETEGDSTTVENNRVEELHLRKFRKYPHLDRVGALTIKESYGAKIDTIVKLIMFLKINHEDDEEPGKPSRAPQIIIYSQYTDFLDILSNVMTRHDIKHYNAVSATKLSKAVTKFKKDPEITCLLLNVRRQASGLTLINATHVFILEPIINGSDEAQAVNRVHRIGQKNETSVWHFMVRNTVEQNIINYKCVLEEKKADHRKKKLESALSQNSDYDPDVDNESEDDYEFNNAGDESVSDKHIWNCFFQRRVRQIKR